MLEFKRIFLLVSIISLVLMVKSAIPSNWTLPSIEMDMYLDFSNEPVLGEELTITFSFTPKQDIECSSDLNDVAKISLPGGVELVSGECQWEGKLVKGKTEIIEVMVKLVKPGWYTFQGVVKSCQKEINLVHRERIPKEEVANRLPTRGFKYKNIISETFEIEGEEEQWMEVLIDSANTGNIKKVKIPRDDKILEDKGINKSNSELLDSTEGGEQDQVKVYRFDINVIDTLKSSDNERFLGDIELEEGQSVTVFLYRENQENPIEAELEVEDECAALRKLSEGKVELTALKEMENCRIIANYGGLRYLIHVLILNEPINH